MFCVILRLLIFIFNSIPSAPSTRYVSVSSESSVICLHYTTPMLSAVLLAAFDNPKKFCRFAFYVSASKELAESLQSSAVPSGISVFPEHEPQAGYRCSFRGAARALQLGQLGGIKSFMGLIGGDGLS